MEGGEEREDLQVCVDEVGIGRNDGGMGEEGEREGEGGR